MSSGPTESEENAAESANGDSDAPPTSDRQWQIVDYGMPVVVVAGGSLELHVYDVNSGDPLHKFVLRNDSCYTELDSHFHAFLDYRQTGETDEIYFYGISTPDEAVAKKLLGAVKQTMPFSNQSLSELGAPQPKRGRFEDEGESNPLGDDEWVIIDRKDVPEIEDEEEEEEEEVMEDGDDGSEGTDSALVRLRPGMKRRRKSQEQTRRSLVIGEPKEFRHIAHVGQDTSVSNMTKAMSVDISHSQDISACSSLELGGDSMAGSVEPGTEETSSFMEVPKEDLPAPPPPPPAPVPPPPPPVVKPPAPIVFGKKGSTKPLQSQAPAISLEEILKRRGTLRPVGGQKVVPEPPPKPDRTKLFTDINTFDRNTLKHIEHKNKDSTDLDDPSCLQSILKASLQKMRDKLSTNFCPVGTVNIEGDEEGFGDECDGPLFNEE